MAYPDLSETIDNVAIDAEKIHEASAKDTVVTPRDGDPYNSIPRVVRMGTEKIDAVVEQGTESINNFETQLRAKVNDALVQSGGFIIVKDVAALTAITPTVDYNGAMLYNGDYYSWNPTIEAANKWEYTGRNFLNNVMIEVEQKITEVTTDLTTTTEAKLTPLENALLKSPRVNLDLKALATSIGFIGIDGRLINDENWSCTDYIPVEATNHIVVATVGHPAVSSVALFDADKVFIRGYIGATTDAAYNVDFVVDNQAKFIRVTYLNASTFPKQGTLIKEAQYRSLITKDQLDVEDGAASHEALITNNWYTNQQGPYSSWDRKGFFTLDGVNYIADPNWASINPRPVKAGQTITATIYGGGLGADASGLFFTPDSGGTKIRVAANGTTQLKTFTYTPTEDGVFFVTSAISGAGLPGITSLRYSVTRDGLFTPIEYTEKVDQLDRLANYWKGKKIVWVGTSIPAITDGSGYSYPKRIGEILGCNMQNNSVGESFITYNAANPNVVGAASFKTLSATVDEIKAFYGALYPSIPTNQLTAYGEAASYEKLIIGTNADLVVFDHLHNDIEKGYVTLGELNNNTDRSTFYGAFNYIIEKLYKDNPYVRIAFVSCPNRFVRPNGAYTLEKFDLYREALRQLALKYNAEFIDLAILSNVNQMNYPLWTQGNDGGTITADQATGGQGSLGDIDLIHPSSKARERYAAILAERIRNIA